MKTNYYNNFGIGVIAIGAVLGIRKEISIAQACLIYPLFSHQELLYYLARKTTRIKSIEELIVKRTSNFSNFNSRYYDSLSETFSSLQYLNDMGYVRVSAGQIVLLKNIGRSDGMGSRAEKIFLASENISKILDDRVENLYLNLRVKL